MQEADRFTNISDIHLACTPKKKTKQRVENIFIENLRMLHHDYTDVTPVKDIINTSAKKGL